MTAEIQPKGTRMGSPLTVALLGCGAVVQDLYLPALRMVSDVVRVTHCVDVSPDASRRMAQELGAAAVSGGLDALLAAAPTDGVIVSTPNTLHAEGVVRCLTAGRHVFCEKPVAIRSEECDAIERSLAGSDRVLAVNLLRRCFPASMAMKHLVATRAVGQPRRITAVEGSRGGWNSRSGFQFSRRIAGGGVTMDRGPHMFDLLIGWFGMPDVERYCDDAQGECEATSITELSWPGGLRAIVKLSKLEDWGSLITVEGETGRLEWSLSRLGSATVTSRDEAGAEFDAVVRLRGTQDLETAFDVVARMLRQWVGATRGVSPNPTPFEEVRASVDLIERCYARRQPARPAWLEYRD